MVYSFLKFRVNLDFHGNLLTFKFTSYISDDLCFAITVHISINLVFVITIAVLLIPIALESINAKVLIKCSPVGLGGSAGL